MLSKTSRKIFKQPYLRYWLPFVLMLALGMGGLAQEDSSRVLIPGQPMMGEINPQNISQMYFFSAPVDDTATLTLTPQPNFALTMVVSSRATGENIGQVIGDGLGEIRLEGLSVAASQVYFVTIFPTAGVPTPIEGNFTLTLGLSSVVIGGAVPAEASTPETTTDQTTTDDQATTDQTTTETEAELTRAPFQPNTQVLISGGIQVNLRWDTTDDLNLQIRDPNGGTLFWDSRTTVDGGVFGPDVNGLCQVLTQPAVETATWPGGPLPGGSYEVLIYYRQACEGNNPVNFSVDVTVDGVELAPIEGALLPPVNNIANVFISSFIVNPDGSARIGESGPYTDTRELVGITTSELLALPDRPVILNQPLEGLITSEQPFETFTFEGLGNQVVNIRMNALNGNLDPLLLLLDSSGNIIAGNDDVDPVVDINAGILDFRLPVDDVYTIVASRYGKIVGGTEGNYTLSVTGSDTPSELSALNLPPGDIEVTLIWDAPVDLQLLVRDPSGNSVYDDVPTVPSGGILGADGNVNCNIVPTGRPVSYIYWPPGFLRIGAYEIEVWYQSECNNLGPADFSLFVVVEGQLVFADTVTFEFNQRYVTSFFIDAQGVASPSAAGIIGGSETLNYIPEIPNALTISSGQTVPGSITADDKFDLYVFEGQAGDVVTISMTATSPTLDTLLFLIDPNGIEIAVNDDVSPGVTDSLIDNLLLSQDGQYIIIATHYGAAFGGTTGGYTLTLQIEN